MVMADVREKLIAKIDDLTNEQIESLLNYVDSMELGTFTDKSETGRNALVGFISVPKDAAERTEEILWAEFGLRKPDDKD